VIPASLLLAGCGGGDVSGPPLHAGGSCPDSSGGKCSLVVDGVTRTFVVHVPGNFQPGVGGLVIAFHGSRGSGAQFEKDTRLSEKADQAGFAAAYPDGLANPNGATTWNAYFNPTVGADPPDDAGFVRQIILALETELRVNPKRVYVTGVSAGGYMAHRAAIDNSDLVAAAGVVEGSLDVQSAGGTREPPRAEHPVSVLILHGDADQVIAYCGLTNTNVTVASQDQTFDYWSRTSNACATLNVSSGLCTGFSGTPTSVTTKIAMGCHGGTEVRLYRLAGGTHSWYQLPMNVPPGTASQPYNPDLGAATGVVTGDILWSFFMSHAKP
jgi:polyhydroxybutyrate depolymerase